MKLKNFKIQSYRSCLKTEIDFQDKLTALIGVNSAGKTNILNAILLLKKICRSRFLYNKNSEENINNSCLVKLEIEHESKSIYMKGEIIIETDERNVDEVKFTNLEWNLSQYIAYSKWFKMPMEYFLFLKEIQSKTNNNNQIQVNSYFNSIVGTKGVTLPEGAQLLLSNIANFFQGINYYSASQFSDPSQCPLSIELDENRNIRKYSRVTSHSGFINDLYRLFKSQDKYYKRYLNTINAEGIGLIDKVSFKEFSIPSSRYEISSGGEVKSIEGKKLLIVPVFTIEGVTLSPNQLSEGTFKTLALIFYILTDDSKLLLIEEPEVYIHQGLLRSLVSLIKTQSNHKQIIISTHSDYILDLLKPENVVLIKLEKGKGTTANPLAKILSKNNFNALRIYLKNSGNLGDYWREGGFEQ